MCGSLTSATLWQATMPVVGTPQNPVPNPVVEYSVPVAPIERPCPCYPNCPCKTPMYAWPVRVPPPPPAAALPCPCHPNCPCAAPPPPEASCPAPPVRQHGGSGAYVSAQLTTSSRHRSSLRGRRTKQTMANAATTEGETVIRLIHCYLGVRGRGGSANTARSEAVQELQ